MGGKLGCRTFFYPPRVFSLQLLTYHIDMQTPPLLDFGWEDSESTFFSKIQIRLFFSWISFFERERERERELSESD